MQNQAQTWEVSNLPQLLDDLIIGDCREDLILKKAQVKKYCSVLILTSQVKADWLRVEKLRSSLFNMFKLRSFFS